MASMQLMESPAFLKKLVESNQELAPMYQELIEEGIKDGSIKHYLNTDRKYLLHTLKDRI